MYFQGLDFALKLLLVGALPFLQKRPWMTAGRPCDADGYQEAKEIYS
jgi:hypothetical protein